MNIILNGNKENLGDNLTIIKLLEKYNLNPDYTVVEVNACILQKNQIESFIIKENDVIELIRFMGGG